MSKPSEVPDFSKKLTGPVWRSFPDMDGYSAEPGTGDKGMTCADCWEFNKSDKTCDRRVVDTGRFSKIKKTSPACADFWPKFDPNFD